MFNFKPVLAATIIALAVPLAATSPSFAQGTKAQGYSGGGGGHGGGGGGGHMGRGGGGGGGGGGHMGRGGGGGGGHMSRGGGFGGGGRHMGGGGWHGGGHHGGRHFGHHRHFGGFYPGFAFGVGSAFASPYYYNDSYGYYDDGPAVEVVPSGGDDIAYCQQRFKSYDVRSGTYLGYDGNRHPCP